MTEPNVCALGSNGSGQLGIGHTDDVETPQKCIFITRSEEGRQAGSATRQEAKRFVDDGIGVGNVKKIVAGGNHTLTLTEHGRLFVAGKSGIADETSLSSQDTTVFREITHLVAGRDDRGSKDSRAEQEITDVAATWEASFAVVGERVILSCGKGLKGELGAGPPSSSDHDPPANNAFKTVLALAELEESEDVKIIAIQASMAHVVVLLSNGHVYGWGASRKGQLGEGFKHWKIVWKAARLDFGVDGTRVLPFIPERVVLGREHTVVLKMGAKAVVWGSKAVSFLEEDADEWVLGQDDVIVSGWSSVHMLRAKTATVCSVGRNHHGQLAPAGLPLVRKVAAGSEHCVAVTNDNRIIGWGWSEHGNCGGEIDEKGNLLDPWNLIPISQLNISKPVKGVAAGCATTFVIFGNDEG